MHLPVFPLARLVGEEAAPAVKAAPAVAAGPDAPGGFALLLPAAPASAGHGGAAAPAAVEAASAPRAQAGTGAAAGRTRLPLVMRPVAGAAIGPGQLTGPAPIVLAPQLGGSGGGFAWPIQAAAGAAKAEPSWESPGRAPESDEEPDAPASALPGGTPAASPPDPRNRGTADPGWAPTPIPTHMLLPEALAEEPAAEPPGSALARAAGRETAAATPEVGLAPVAREAVRPWPEALAAPRGEPRGTRAQPSITPIAALPESAGARAEPSPAPAAAGLPAPPGQAQASAVLTMTDGVAMAPEGARASADPLPRARIATVLRGAPESRAAAVSPPQQAAVAPPPVAEGQPKAPVTPPVGPGPEAVSPAGHPPGASRGVTPVPVADPPTASRIDLSRMAAPAREPAVAPPRSAPGAAALPEASAPGRAPGADAAATAGTEGRVSPGQARRGTIEPPQSAAAEPVHRPAPAPGASAAAVPAVAPPAPGPDGRHLNLPDSGLTTDIRPGEAFASDIRPAPAAQEPPQASGPARAEIARSAALQIAAIVQASGERATEVRLNPEELGRVSLMMSQDGSTLAITLSAERPETLDMIRRHIDILADELRRLGYGALNFSFGDEAARHGKRTAAEPPPDAENAPARAPAEPADEPVPPAARAPGARGPGGMDLRI